LAILNRDDPSYGFFRERARDRVVTFGAHAGADVRGTLVAARPDGSTVSVRAPGWSGQLEIPLVGAFNVENALAAFAWAIGWGIDPDVAASAMASARGVAGRMEPVDEGQPFTVVVDYAHSPDALEKVIRVLRPLTAGRLAVVFGSAGERDTAKRALMGRIAAELADLAYVTDEDPRGEDPDALNAQIAAGARAAGARDGENLWVINDRRSAIAAAVAAAGPGDSLLLAGKGHEHSIVYADGAAWWDEAEVARQELRAAGYERSHR
ncbi:MAG: Mur ligase family protein, partial [Chloroflexota bacterium]|nr:Mur ligase family protein [Chloroflexota bacterium]